MCVFVSLFPYVTDCLFSFCSLADNVQPSIEIKSIRFYFCSIVIMEKRITLEIPPRTATLIEELDSKYNVAIE